MSAPELRAVEHSQWLHAHFQGQSRDCDGPMSYGHTTWLAALTEGVIEDSPKARDDFEALLLRWSVSFTNPPTQLEAGMNDDGEPYISYHRQTEEGYESGRWDLCRDRFCHEDEAAGPWKMDEASVTIELSDGTVAYVVMTDEIAENIADAIERMTGLRMNVRT